MKGIGIGLLMSLVIVAIFFIAGLLFFGFGNFSVSEFDCEQDISQQTNDFISKMSNPGAGDFPPQQFRVGTCVEYISTSGIKLKSQEKILELSIAEGRNGCSTNGGCPVTFEFSGSDKILPRDAPYYVTLKSQERKIVIER